MLEEIYMNVQMAYHILSIRNATQNDILSKHFIPSMAFEVHLTLPYAHIKKNNHSYLANVTNYKRKHYNYNYSK